MEAFQTLHGTTLKVAKIFSWVDMSVAEYPYTPAVSSSNDNEEKPLNIEFFYWKIHV